MQKNGWGIPGLNCWHHTVHCGSASVAPASIIADSQTWGASCCTFVNTLILQT